MDKNLLLDMIRDKIAEEINLINSKNDNGGEITSYDEDEQISRTIVNLAHVHDIITRN